MKKISLTLTLLLTFNIQAESQVDRYCLLIEKFSEKIMSIRQEGRSLEEVMKMYNEGLEGDNSTYEVFKKLIFKAYETPLYKYRKDETINEFKNKYYLQCLIQYNN